MPHRPSLLPASQLCILSRNTKKIVIPKFKEQLSSALSEKCNESNINELDSVIRDVLDNHAPLTERTVNERMNTPWFTKEMKTSKQDKRRAETKWRKTKLQIHKEIYIFHKKKLKRITTKSKSDYYRNKFNNVNTSKDFFHLANELLGKNNKLSLPSHKTADELAERFSDFFINKISIIRERLNKHNVHTEVPCYKGEIFASFVELSVDEVKNIICSAPNKSCRLDPIQTSLLKTCIDEIAPYITDVINKSLRSGVVPDIFKTAHVTPLLKKKGLNLNELKNYRPVSNLPFLSKILEKVVLKQILEHLDRNNLQISFQSAYRKNHSTETALLRTTNDLLHVIDNGRTTILSLLDLSAAFDTIDHSILISRLQHTFGFSGTVLLWFTTYLKNRKQKVSVGNVTSSERELPFGVPQGSVLGPVLFVLYTSPLSNTIERHNLAYHMYADDTEIYNTDLTVDLKSKITSSEHCILDISQWMSANRLQLNGEKTEVLSIGSRHNLKTLQQTTIDIDNSVIPFSNKVKSLGIILDSQLSMDDHISYLRVNLICDLRRICSIRPFITQEACKTLVVSIIFSKLDYCNSLFFGLTSDKLKRLQSIQNNAARIIFKKKRRDDVIPLLIQLHWLPVRQRIDYKAATMVFKCLHGSAPSYLCSLLTTYEPTRVLRSSNNNILKIPSTKLKVGERSFSFYGPKVWNNLPSCLRHSKTLDVFKKHLKTYLFRQWLDSC